MKKNIRIGKSNTELAYVLLLNSYHKSNTRKKSFFLSRISIPFLIFDRPRPCENGPRFLYLIMWPRGEATEFKVLMNYPLF